MADAQAYAEEDLLEIRSMQATDDTTITIVVTCGAGMGS